MYSLVCAGLTAQDLDKVQPAPVPQLVEAEPVSEQPTLDLNELRSDMIGANGDEEIILDELKQIVFLSDATQLDRVQLEGGKTSNLSDYPDLNTEGMRGIVELFVGLPVSQESLQRLRYSLKIMLGQDGRPFSLVYTPPQDITDGTVQIVIQLSSVGAVRIEGTDYFSEQSYLSRLKVEPNGDLDAAAIRTAIDRINQNAFRSAALRVEKGSEPGTTDVVLQVKERRPYRVFVGYNNTGSVTTTEDRMFAGFTLGNVFGLAHQMTLQATTDIEAKYSKSVSGNYSMDLPYNHTAVLFGAYSEIIGVPGSGFDQQGTSWQLGMNYSIPLPALSASYSQNVELGFDYKSSDNNLELNLPPFIIPISDNLTHVVQVRGQYRGTLQDAYGSTSFGAKLTYSPGDLARQNDDEAFSQSRAFAAAEYVYGNLDVSRTTNFKGFLQDWTWLVRGELQISDTNLLGSEQYSAGGSYSVRGYSEGEVVGDNAFFVSQELQFPAIQTTVRLPGYKKPGILRFFVFEDYAKTWNTDKLVGENAFFLHSVGAGLRYQVAQNFTLNAAHGWQLRDSGSSDTGDNRRMHISLQLSY